MESLLARFFMPEIAGFSALCSGMHPGCLRLVLGNWILSRCGRAPGAGPSEFTSQLRL